MATIVRQSRQPLSRWESGSHQPASRNQSRLPTTLTPTFRVALGTIVRPNGQGA
jgi:hypothetical protein